MKTNHTPSRRKMLMLAAAAMSTGIIPILGHTDDDSHGDYDSDGKYASGSNTTFALANTGLTGNVVVIGGGMAGITAAKYLRLWGGAGIHVTLVEPNLTYTSNIMSNLVLNNSRTLSSLAFGYTSVATKYGVVVKQASLRSINATAKSVALSDGSTLVYDRLVVAPGVDFMDAYGLTQSDYDSKTPHAWRAGPQTELLRTQLAGIPSNGTFVMTIPKAPYRCPPGPYERACLVADFLKNYKGAASKVIVLDENASIQAEVDNFTYAFNTIHRGVIDYRSGVTSIQINPDTKAVTYIDQLGSSVSINAHVVNPIPPHRAAGSSSAGWLANAGLNNSLSNGIPDGRWCVVDVLSYESTVVAGVHVIGDAASCGLPKAGHVANQEAKICADAIIRTLAGQPPDSAPVANSACYSPITASTASWLTAVYQYDAATHKMVVAANGGVTAGARATEAANISNANFQQMNTWFNTLMGDSFV
jgi:NADPH-dependent 2,4-dienoyl-CoA reductase/sulfur reductase-like enzyme